MIGDHGMPALHPALISCLWTPKKARALGTGTWGHYLFGVDTPGEYQVVCVPPPGYAFSPANVGEDQAINSKLDPATGRTAAFPVRGGDAILTQDAGLHAGVWPPLALAGHVSVRRVDRISRRRLAKHFF